MSWCLGLPVFDSCGAFFSSGLLVGYIALRDRNKIQYRTCAKKILVLVVALLYAVAIYFTVIKQVNEINEGNSSYECPIYNYTKTCQNKCFGKEYNETFNCNVTFCS